MPSRRPRELAKRDDETRAQWLKRLTPEQRQELRKWNAEHRFHPHRLRHSFATEVRREFGPEAQMVLLGHRTTRMVDLYGELDRQLGVKVMQKIG